MILIFREFLKQISQGEYGNNYSSILERAIDDQLKFTLNDDYHHQYSVEFKDEFKQIAVVLQKQKEDYSGIDLILLGYLELPIDDSNQDALLQKVLNEIQGQHQELIKLEMHKNLSLSVYKMES